MHRNRSAMPLEFEYFCYDEKLSLLIHTMAITTQTCLHIVLNRFNVAIINQ